MNQLFAIYVIYCPFPNNNHNSIAVQSSQKYVEHNLSNGKTLNLSKFLIEFIQRKVSLILFFKNPLKLKKVSKIHQMIGENQSIKYIFWCEKCADDYLRL